MARHPHIAVLALAAWLGAWSSAVAEPPATAAGDPNAPATRAPAGRPAARTEAELPHAGLSIRLPKGFAFRTVRQPLQVAAAGRETPAGAETLSLWAFPVDSAVKVETFADAMLTEFGRDGEISSLRVLAKAPLRIAGWPALARRVSYQRGGSARTAVRAYFVRGQDDSRDVRYRLCYFLSLEAPGGGEGLAGSFQSLVEGLAPMSLQPPGAGTVGPAGAGVPLGEHLRCRLPLGWLKTTGAGPERLIAAWGDRVVPLDVLLTAQQIDFRSGGRSGPALTLVSASGAEGASHAELGRLAERATGQPASVRPADGNAVRLAGRPAVQWVRRLPGRREGSLTARPRTTGPGEYLVVRAAAGSDTLPRGLVLLLRCRADSAAEARRWMQPLAASLTCSEPATQPTSRPATRSASPPARRTQVAPGEDALPDRRARRRPGGR